MPSARLKFPGAFGDVLAARLDEPEGGPRAWALFAHCFTCGKDLKAAGWISQGLAARGIATLRFDFTGIGESEGEFADTNFSSNLDDLRAAAAFMRSTGRSPGLLVGHSLGGAAVLAVASEMADVRAVATIAAPSDTAHFRDTLARRLPDLESTGEAEITLGGRRFRVRRQLLDDLSGHTLARRVATLGKPLLVFHSPADATVSVEHGHRIFAAAKEPKSFVSLDRADHVLLSDRRDARWLSDVLGAWAWRYLAD